MTEEAFREIIKIAAHLRCGRKPFQRFVTLRTVSDRPDESAKIRQRSHSSTVP